MLKTDDKKLTVNRQFLITQDTHEQLQAIAKIRGINYSVVLRDAVMNFVDNWRTIYQVREAEAEMEIKTEMEQILEGVR